MDGVASSVTCRLGAWDSARSPAAGPPAGQENWRVFSGRGMRLLPPAWPAGRGAPDTGASPGARQCVPRGRGVGHSRGPRGAAAWGSGAAPP